MCEMFCRLTHRLARLRMRGPKRLSTGSHAEAARVCACVDQRDCLRARTPRLRAFAHAWTKEVVYGLARRGCARLRMRGPKRLSTVSHAEASRFCACVDQRDCLRACTPRPRASAHAWTKEIVYGLARQGCARLRMLGPKRLSTGSHAEASRVCACVDQGDCVWARAPKPHTSAHIRGPMSAGCAHGPTARAGLSGCVPSVSPPSVSHSASSPASFFCFASLLPLLLICPLLLCRLFFCFASIPFCFASSYFAFF